MGCVVTKRFRRTYLNSKNMKTYKFFKISKTSLCLKCLGILVIFSNAFFASASLPIFKNDRARDFWRDSWAIIPYELAKLLYILIAEWSTVAMIPKVIKGLNTMRTKRITAHSNYKLPIG